MSTRPTKKQRELLAYIDTFIKEHGYSPSYREIMHGLNYNSVATVSLHINNLIRRGHLVKRDYSARSLEVVSTDEQGAPLMTNEVAPAQEKWLVERVDFLFHQAQQSRALRQSQLDELYVLVGALKVLGLDGAAQSFISKLSDLKKKVT
jgi:hypothetical protein